MVIVTFPDKATERKALGFLLGKFSGRVFKNGDHLIPEPALEALARQNLPFIVKENPCEQSSDPTSQS